MLLQMNYVFLIPFPPNPEEIHIKGSERQRRVGWLEKEIRAFSERPVGN